eukprot:CAMPEP_0172817544 /NCGR_PEP_ID=MMETSP1075-20121228/13280_1 /TAXON_ID=2916 /ORGANISM="Ceratium fusus, Strain PA161109" /LENGTH=229 /DNA_ID=CAMNT_0013657761 /DNA_START=41 /DNA_END=727 /DNA_ORIENTATION=-
MASSLAQRRGLAKKAAILTVEVRPTFSKALPSSKDEIASPSVASPEDANTGYGCSQQVASSELASPKLVHTPQVSDPTSPKCVTNPPSANNWDSGSSHREAPTTETIGEVATVRILSACGIPEGRASLGTGSTYSSGSSICPGSPQDAVEASTTAEIAAVFGDAGTSDMETHLQGHAKLGESRRKSWVQLQMEMQALATVLDQLHEVREMQMAYVQQLKAATNDVEKMW